MALNFKKHYKAYIVTSIISVIIGVIAFLIFFFWRGAAFQDAVDAITFSAILLLGIGGLMFVAYEGFFDIFAFGFKQMFTSMFAKKANANNDFAGYKEDKRISREESPKIFLSVLVAGLLFLILMIALRIVLFTK